MSRVHGHPKETSTEVSDNPHGPCTQPASSQSLSLPSRLRHTVDMAAGWRLFLWETWLPHHEVPHPTPSCRDQQPSPSCVHSGGKGGSSSFLVVTGHPELLPSWDGCHFAPIGINTYWDMCSSSFIHVSVKAYDLPTPVFPTALLLTRASLCHNAVPMVLKSASGMAFEVSVMAPRVALPCTRPLSIFMRVPFPYGVSFLPPAGSQAWGERRGRWL